MNTLLDLPETEVNPRLWTSHITPSSSQAGPLPTKRVLIVDDDATVRASLCAVLECEGYEVRGAADGHAAVRCTTDQPPDLVLLDLNMPKMDGWTAFVRIENARPLVPIIVITARPHQYRQAVRIGVDAFMEKPLNIGLLLRAIHKLTHESKERHTRRITDPRFITHWLDNKSMPPGHTHPSGETPVTPHP